MRILAGILAFMIIVLLGLVILIGELIKKNRKSK